MNPPPTVVAVLTPPGTAAIATLALVGPAAWTVARTLFEPTGGPLPDPPPLDQFWHGRFGGPTGDTVVLAVRRLSPVPWVEVHSHGGAEVVRWLTQLLQEQGVTLREWSDAQALAGDPPWKIAAAAALAQAPTGRTAAILLDQFHGALANALDQVDRLLGAGEYPTAAARLEELQRQAPLGQHLIRPWRVAIAGAPNVGKSSLVNAIAGYQRSVVTPVPGTTRDVVSTVLAIDGWPVELLDTAGQHDPTDPLEATGIQLARAAAAGADLCLWVVDVTAPPVWPAVALPNAVTVLNKTDQPAAWDVATVPDAPAVSARTGAGLDRLLAAISQRLVPEPPPPAAAVPFTPELAECVTAALEAVRSGQPERARDLIRRTFHQ